MPLVTRFADGLQIRINAGDHHPAHIHCRFRGQEVLLVIADGSIYSGTIPTEQLAVARDYLAANRAALMERFFQINHHLPRNA